MSQIWEENKKDQIVPRVQVNTVVKKATMVKMWQNSEPFTEEGSTALGIIVTVKCVSIRY